MNGYEPIEKIVGNHEGDRHVLAAAIRAHAGTIVSFNLRHFRKEDLDPWDILAAHPGDYLLTLFAMDPGVVVSKLSDIAANRGERLPAVLSNLHKLVPLFAAHVSESIGVELDAPN